MNLNNTNGVQGTVPPPDDQRKRADMLALLRDPRFTMTGGSEFALEIIAALGVATPPTGQKGGA